MYPVEIDVSQCPDCPNRSKDAAEIMRVGRFAFVVLPEFYTKEKGYFALTAMEGAQGLYTSKLFCGHDYEMAVWYANQKNKSLGIDPETASRIIEAACLPITGAPQNDRPI